MGVMVGWLERRGGSWVVVEVGCTSVLGLVCALFCPPKQYSVVGNKSRCGRWEVKQASQAGHTHTPSLSLIRHGKARQGKVWYGEIGRRRRVR